MSQKGAAGALKPLVPYRILASKQFPHEPRRRPAVSKNTRFHPGLSSLSGKPLVAAFDGGRLSSDSGVLLLGEIDRRIGISKRLAGCLRDD